MLSRLIRGHLARFRDEDRAAISTEFVLILPLLLWWYVGSFAFYDAFRDYNVTVKASYTIGDILSRQTEIDNDYIDGLETLLEFMTAGSGAWLRVSSIRYNSDEEYEVEWSYATDDHTVVTDARIYTWEYDEDVLPIMAEGETIILSETYVPFTPAFNVGLSARWMSNLVVTRPRFTSQVVNDDF
jgi:hypothetical protein